MILVKEFEFHAQFLEKAFFPGNSECAKSFKHYKSTSQGIQIVIISCLGVVSDRNPY